MYSTPKNIQKRMFKTTNRYEVCTFCRRTVKGCNLSTFTACCHLIHTSEAPFAQVQCSPRYNGKRQTDISLDWSQW